MAQEIAADVGFDFICRPPECVQARVALHQRKLLMAYLAIVNVMRPILTPCFTGFRHATSLR